MMRTNNRVITWTGVSDYTVKPAAGYVFDLKIAEISFGGSR